MPNIGLFTERTRFGGGERALSLFLQNYDTRKINLTFFCTTKLWDYPEFNRVGDRVNEVCFIDDFLLERTKKLKYRHRFASLERQIRSAFYLRSLFRKHHFKIIHIAYIPDRYA